METKPWWQSKAIIGSIVIVIVLALRLLGKQSEADVVEESSAGIADWLVGIAGFVGAALTFWGRLTAEKKVTLTK